MKRSSFLQALLWTALVALLGLPNTASAQGSPPRTVADYFLRLPARYFDSPAQRKALLDRPGRTTLDIKNDYLFLSGDGAQSALTVAIFRHAGRALIAVFEYPEMESGTTENLAFYRYEGGTWKNVTRAVSPVAYSRKYEYELPRRGTTIRIKDTRGKVVMHWVWSGGRFWPRLL